MLMHARVAAVSRRAPSSFALQAQNPWAALLAGLGAIANEKHIIILGKNGTDLMC
jgi:hypothetical protein